MVLRRLPKWQQIFIFCVLMMLCIFAADWAKQHYRDGAQARLLKQKIVPLAEQLAASDKVGYLLNRDYVDTEVASLLNQYNALTEEQQRKFNAGPVKYCLIAIMNIGHGVDEIDRYKSWISRDKYRAALDECK